MIFISFSHSIQFQTPSEIYKDFTRDISSAGVQTILPTGCIDSVVNINFFFFFESYIRIITIKRRWSVVRYGLVNVMPDDKNFLSRCVIPFSFESLTVLSRYLKIRGR